MYFQLPDGNQAYNGLSEYKDRFPHFYSRFYWFCHTFNSETANQIWDPEIESFEECIRKFVFGFYIKKK